MIAARMMLDASTAPRGRDVPRRGVAARIAFLTALLTALLMVWALPFFSLHLTHHAFESEPDCTVSQIALSGAAACPAAPPSLALPAAAAAQYFPPPTLRLEKPLAHPQARAPPPGRA